MSYFIFTFMSCRAHGTAQGRSDSEVKLLVPLVPTQVPPK